VDLPEVHAAGFSGGILWAILADLPGTPRLWVPRWKYEGGDKPWKVRVTGLASIHSPPQTVVGLTEAERSLRSALESALDFSTRAELEWFPGAFSKALALLDSETPEIPYHPDLLPSSGYSLLARKIAASSSMAYVFGGMGSFNDIWFGGHRLKTAYKVLLPTLYNAVTDGLLAAADSFGRQ